MDRQNKCHVSIVIGKDKRGFQPNVGDWCDLREKGTTLSAK